MKKNNRLKNEDKQLKVDLTKLLDTTGEFICTPF